MSDDLECLARLPNRNRQGRSRLAIHIALFATGVGAFLSLYCTQPLLPLFRQLYQVVSELQASLRRSVLCWRSR